MCVGLKMYRLFMIILFLLTILYVKSEEAALTRKERGKRQVSLTNNPIFSLVFQTNCSLPSIFFRRGCTYSNLGYTYEAPGQVLAPAPVRKIYTTEKTTHVIKTFPRKKITTPTSVFPPASIKKTFTTKKTTPVATERTTSSSFQGKYYSPENNKYLYGTHFFPPLTQRKEHFIELDSASDKKFPKYNFKDFPILIKMTPVVQIFQNQPKIDTKSHIDLPTFENVNFFEDDTKSLGGNKTISSGNNKKGQSVEEKIAEVGTTTTDHTVIITNVHDVDRPQLTSSTNDPKTTKNPETTTIGEGVSPNGETGSTNEKDLSDSETQQKVTIVEPPQKNNTFSPTLDIERIKPLNPHYYNEIKAIRKLMEDELKETIEKSLCNVTAVKELWEDRMKLRRDFDIPKVRVNDPYLFRQLAMIDQWLANDLAKETKKCSEHDLNPEKHTFKSLPMFERYQPFKVVSNTNNASKGGPQEDLDFASSDINEVISSDKPSENEVLKPTERSTNVTSFGSNTPSENEIRKPTDRSTNVTSFSSDTPSEKEVRKPTESSTNVISFGKNEKTGEANLSVPASTGIPFEANAVLNTPLSEIENTTENNFQKPASLGRYNSHPIHFAVPHFVRYQKFKSEKTDDSLTTPKTESPAQNNTPTGPSKTGEPQTTSAARIVQSNVQVVTEKTQKPKTPTTTTSRLLPSAEKNYIFKEQPSETEKLNGENTEKDPFIAFVEQYPGFKDIFWNTSATEMSTPLRGDVPANAYISSKILNSPEITEIITNNLQNTVNDSGVQNPINFLKTPQTEDPKSLNLPLSESTEPPQANVIEKTTESLSNLGSLQKQTNFGSHRPGPVVLAVPHYVRHQVFKKAIKNEEQATTTETSLTSQNVLGMDTEKSNKKILVEIIKRPLNKT